MSDTLVITAGTIKNPVMDVEGRNVMITGGGCKVSLTGHCTELRIIGDEHDILAENVDSLNLMGSRNTIEIDILGSAKFRGEENNLIWKQAPEGRLAPSFSLSGEGNNVSMARR